MQVDTGYVGSFSHQQLCLATPHGPSKEMEPHEGFRPKCFANHHARSLPLAQWVFPPFRINEMVERSKK